MAADFDYTEQAERYHARAQAWRLAAMLLDAFTLGLITGAWLVGRKG